MSNTGTKIVLTLKQIVSGSGTPTGLTEPNLPSEPEFISPYVDISACPISFSMTCPVVAATGGSILEFEFSLANSVVNNPDITTVKVLAISQSITQGTITFPLPNSTPNYFSGSFNSLTLGSYSLSVQYFSASIVQKSCSIAGSYGVS